MDAVRRGDLAKNTLIIYMGDNGFHLGEHGFYDKRDAFETSIRVPMLAWAPGLIEAGSHTDRMIQNIDIAPTALSIASAGAGADAKSPSGNFDGRSFAPILQGKRNVPWRDHILYEYHWSSASLVSCRRVWACSEFARN